MNTGGIRKLANAFISDATPSDLLPALALSAIDRFKILANDIRAVRHEFGWVTGIVVVEHIRGEFRFRCYGAKQLAATMNAWFNVS